MPVSLKPLTQGYAVNRQPRASDGKDGDQQFRSLFYQFSVVAYELYN